MTTDIAIVFDPVTGIFDYAMDGSQLALDHGISTAIILSFYCDKRADAGDVLPQEQPGPFGLNTKTGGDRRGWFGDFMTAANAAILPGQSYPAPADRIGSRFWLFKRRKMTAGLPAEIQAEGYDCTKWLIEDGIATAITMTAIAVGKETILLRGTVQLASGSRAAFLLPVMVGGGSYPLPPGVAGGDYGQLGVFTLDRDLLS